MKYCCNHWKAHVDEERSTKALKLGLWKTERDNNGGHTEHCSETQIKATEESVAQVWAFCAKGAVSGNKGDGKYWGVASRAWLHSRSCRRAILRFLEPFWGLPRSSHHLLHMLQMVKCWSISILQIQDCLILSLVPQLHVVVSICLSELWKHTRIIVYIYLLIICWELSDLWTYSLFRNKVVSVERCNLFIGKNKITSFFVLRPLWWERHPCLLCYSLI